jgi:putative membrane protein
MTAREPQPIAPGLYDPAEFVARAPHAVTPLTADAPGDAPPPPLRPTPWRRRFGWMCVALIAFVSGLQAVRFVADAAALAPGLGWVAAGLLLATLSAGLLWIRHEVAEYRRIAAVEALQDESAALLSEDRAGAADAWFAAMARQLASSPGAAPGLARFQAMAVETYAARDALGLFEREVLGALDRAAMAAVGRAARDTALGTAASPLALLDAALVVARSLRMIREIAAIYGFRPGGLAALGLLRRVLVQAVGVAGADLAGELTAEMLGGLGHKVAGTVSTRLGVGLFAGTRVARLGLATLRACRPMPFLAEPPQLAQILRRALSGA